jgi:type I restriction-modification system DNA methylase subunit
MAIPDPSTKDRIRNLAIVGKALNDTYSDENLEVGTDFYLAKEALTKFKEGIDKLDLDESSKKGMGDLIEYLNKKIDRRMGYVGS